MKKLLSLLTLSTAALTITGSATNILTVQNNNQWDIEADKVDISNITMSDPLSPADLQATYESLNNNSQIIIDVINAIYNAKNVHVFANDFAITNDQNPTDFQVAGQKVNFNVKAVDSSERISGAFNFVDTLSTAATDISKGVLIPDLALPADPSKTYGDLNNKSDYVNAVIFGIYNAKSISVIKDVDVKITNDQNPTELQKQLKVVTFTVTGISAKVTGSFTFIETLL